MPELKDILGIEFYFVLKKSYLDREKWEQGLKLMKQEGDWDLF